MTLVREPVDVPGAIDAEGETLVPFHAGETLEWRFAG